MIALMQCSYHHHQQCYCKVRPCKQERIIVLRIEWSAFTWWWSNQMQINRLSLLYSWSWKRNKLSFFVSLLPRRRKGNFFVFLLSSRLTRRGRKKNKEEARWHAASQLSFYFPFQKCRAKSNALIMSLLLLLSWHSFMVYPESIVCTDIRISNLLPSPFQIYSS